MASPKLINFRQKLQANSLDAYLVLHGDAHMSEYTPAVDERVSYISGFTGSAGFALITQEKALLWTDGRYFLQAGQELEEGWELMKMIPEVPNLEQWLTENLKENQTLGFDPLLVPTEKVADLAKKLEANKASVSPLDENLVDTVWEGKSAGDLQQIFRQPDVFAGKTAVEKLKEATEKITELKGEGLMTTELDSIAWALNLRGHDIDFNPLFVAYFFILQKEGGEGFEYNLFVNPDKLSAELKTYLAEVGVTIREYSETISHMKSVSGKKILVTKKWCNHSIYSALDENNTLTSVDSPIFLLKAIKNDVEIQGMKDCHIRDGAAVVMYFAWLEKELNEKGNSTISEHIGAMQVADNRKKQKNFVDLSFPSISSIGANGAIIHYRPDPETCQIISNKEMYLLDSGAQYNDGTTDITRTTHFGEPSAYEKEMYTRVLLGNLNLERIQFPTHWRVSGANLDVLARSSLWSIGKDFLHGTGHGVGHFLNVHEGPHGISRRADTPLKIGNSVTNEPGYYESGAFGIRIENVMVVAKGDFDDFLKFENITIAPYERKLINMDLLNRDDIEHIDNYHKQVRDLLTPILKEQGEEYAITWLNEKTAPLKA